jgi:hypothetical protein
MVPPTLRLINYYQLSMSLHEQSLTDVPPYDVMCIERENSAGKGHDHVIAVETRDPDGGQTRWATVEVIAAVREGERFTVGDEPTASLEPAICPACANVTLLLPQGATTTDCG